MNTSFSKQLRKGDDSAKELIVETLSGHLTGGFDLDSVYCVNGTYYVLEFLKCDTVRPNDSHPRRYWSKNRQKFIALWNITQRLQGTLFLINYEDSRQQFKVMKVLSVTDDDISTKDWLMDFDKFKQFFIKLNNAALQQ